MEVMVFAGLREKLGSKKIILTADHDMTVKDLKIELYRQYPVLDGEVFQVARNESFVRDEHTVSNSDDVALIPPVSGG
jgi:molybdopterin synthase sulfur carrier subunit